MPLNISSSRAFDRNDRSFLGRSFCLFSRCWATAFSPPISLSPLHAAEILDLIPNSTHIRFSSLLLRRYDLPGLVPRRKSRFGHSNGYRRLVKRFPNSTPQNGSMNIIVFLSTYSSTPQIYENPLRPRKGRSASHQLYCPLDVGFELWTPQALSRSPNRVIRCRR